MREGSTSRRRRAAGFVAPEQAGPEGRVAQRAHLIVERLTGHLGEDGVARERVERRLEPEEQPDGSGSHLGPDGEPFSRRPLDLPEQLAPRFGPLVGLGQGHREGPAGQLHQTPDHGELALGVG